MIGRETLKYPEQFTAHLQRLEKRIANLERELAKLKRKKSS